MEIAITANQLIKLGLDKSSAQELLEHIKAQIQICITAEQSWQAISQDLVGKYPFKIHLYIFNTLFPNWRELPELAPAILPSIDQIATANISQFMALSDTQDVRAFHRYTVNHFETFWQRVIDTLQISLDKFPEKICDLSSGIENIQWLPGAKLNIINSCFNAPPDATALLYKNEEDKIVRMTYSELNQLSNRIANSLIALGFKVQDRIAIAMPMNSYAVALYLGIIKMGGVVVSIADSFSSDEIAIRLKIANAKAIFTQDFANWAGKKLPLYERVKNANAPLAIVLPSDHDIAIPLRDSDIPFREFLKDNANFKPVSCDPMMPCNILFSSGTTGVPKAILWNHTTAIKAASDAYFHQNIQPGDVLAWPTNLGWMMGPWLIYAAFINQAAIALYPDAPKDTAFGEFIQNAKVTMLGVVPTLVATWRQSGCMEKLDWRAIKVFSSTGECSNPEDMLYLMWLAGYKPIIEYCGGTEVVCYVTSTVIENNYPSLFSTPAMGLDFIIIDQEGHPAKHGEVAIIPPSMGLSTTLLNADHHRVYYENMPTFHGKILRRHGDEIKQLSNGYYTVLGRVDDTMNLGGIKISTAEIERVIAGSKDIIEVAAIAVTPYEHGPSQLVIYAATTAKLQKEQVMKEMQKKINVHLNPLFKIHDIVFIETLPKTASNKIMRRILRKTYQEKTE